MALLSRGGLIVPSRYLLDFAYGSFAAIYVSSKDILALQIPVRDCAPALLKKFGPACYFICSEHNDWCFKYASKIIINILYNNAQKFVLDSKKKDDDP